MKLPVRSTADWSALQGLLQSSFWVALALTLALSACSRDERAADQTETSTLQAGDQADGDSLAGPNLYAATGINDFSPVAARARHLVYVPNSQSASVAVIDPKTYQILGTFSTGAVPQHVVPSHDPKVLWIANDDGNTLTPIDPETGRVGAPIPVEAPYNLYFTPDGQYALVITEDRQGFDFREPHTMEFIETVPVTCKGLNHVDFTTDDRFAIGSCEFSGELVKLDLATKKIIGYIKLEPGATGKRPMPQDVRSAPDGRTFYIADMTANGIHLVDPVAFERTGFIETGKGTHGIVTGRGGRWFYITNRGWDTMGGGKRGPGSISVLDPTTQSIIATWPVPEGGSPDMGSVSADGKELWGSGRYDSEVYVFDTTTGELTDRIPVGEEPHGLCLWPQPGRYSLGHTGNMR
jgi:DNA-binding beta-propeller fold protein YncE